ncbi:MAG TPA: helicase-related protein [Vicinamibacterales bacterium]|nr:helicase-related protein [Vicinamibacterales bacterium]
MGQIRLRPGDAVRIRDERWRVAAESSFGAASIIEVDGCDATNHGIRTRFLLPFETVDSAARLHAPPRFVTVDRWRRAVRSTLAGAVPRWTSLRAAARANLTVLPFQLEPAIAVARGDACRVLIADDVGLGKTIQAGLIIAEALLRTADARVLIVAPAGLREQWRRELQSRFHVRAEVLDAHRIAGIAADLVADVNPWSIHPLAITSIDFIKRPEVMRSLETLTWDVLVFDEAHALAGRSDRAAAATALGCRARVVVMLTATPHSGDEEAFARLTAVGDIGGAFPLMTFRRTRTDVGFPENRRSSVLNVRPTTAETAMHGALQDYLQRLTDETSVRGAGTSLLSSILLRRACSSAASLARSIERRIALLFNGAVSEQDQLTLPFAGTDSDDEPGFELGVTGLRDGTEERKWLERLAALAGTAAVRESKVQVLRRLLRRIDEPAIVFTEYRDTLQHICAELEAFRPLILHGGLSLHERADVIRRFNEGQTSLLLATDAASEGLNLHHRCRFVVNLEIPWTPLRQEQRVGRVDRIGQARRVHAWTLVGIGTHDEVMARQLCNRAQQIETAFTKPIDHGELRHASQCEADRILTARALSTQAPMPAASPSPVMTSVRRPHCDAREIRAFQLSCADASGHVAFETIAGVRIDIEPVDDLGPDGNVAVACHEQALASAATDIAPWLELSHRREAAIARSVDENHARLSAKMLQPGLFDRRAERVAAAQAARVDEAIARSRDRVDALDRLRQLGCGERRLLFGIRFRP